MDKLFEANTRGLKFYSTLIACLLAMFVTSNLSSQCGSTNIPPGYFCEEAPLICLQNLCNESGTEYMMGWNNFCGNNTIVNNPQYYAFIVESPDVEIQIQVANCSGGAGLQSAIIGDNCPWDISNVIDCNPGTPPGGTMVLQSYGLLTPGNTNWLLIDGSNGATCDYTITSVSGIFMPQLTEELTQLDISEDSVSQGYRWIVLDAVPEILAAQGYYWVFDWSSDTITSTNPFIYIEIPCEIDPGIYSICVRAFTGCDTTEEVCAQIEIYQLTDVIKPSAIVCLEDFPFPWYDILIDTPGIYRHTVTALECPYDIIWEVNAYPEVLVGEIDTNICGYAFNYEGMFYDTSGTYELHYPGQSVSGCDSSAILTLSFDFIDFFVESICVDSQFTLQTHITDHSPSNGDLYYTWFDCNHTQIIWDTESYMPDSAGCYSLVIEHDICMDTVSSFYVTDPCQSDCSLIKENACIDELLLFAYPGETSSEAKFHWLLDLPGAPKTYFDNQPFLFQAYADTGWYNVSLTVIDSGFTTTCIDSFYVGASTSEVSFCCSEVRCDTCTDLMITLSGAAPWTLYIYGTYQSDTFYNVTSSPFIYTTCPPADSMSVYSLEVTDSFNSCFAEITVTLPLYVVLHEEIEASITQTGNMLCAFPDDMNAYNWFNCTPDGNIATTQCITPTSTGCYCVEITNDRGCVDTVCYDLIIDAISNIVRDEISISPVPSNGNWEITFSSKIILPVEWELINLQGVSIEHGKLEHEKSTIQLIEATPSGLYFLKFKTEDQQYMTAKVILQSR